MGHIKTLAKNILSRHPLLLQYFQYIYHIENKHWRPLPGDLDSILSNYFDSDDVEKGIIQIGSNDGVSGDPLFDYITKKRIPAVLVEPVPSLYKKLKNNYSSYGNVHCVNAAIAAEKGHMPFYVVDNTDGLFPNYFAQLGSFDKSVIERQKRDYPEVLDHIKSINVPCMTFEELVATSGLDTCPFIHIDAEGYDLDILENVDVNRFGYKVILFEHVHLDQDRYRNYLKHLYAAGYRVREGLTDTIAIRIARSND